MRTMVKNVRIIVWQPQACKIMRARSKETHACMHAQPSQNQCNQLVFARETPAPMAIHRPGSISMTRKQTLSHLFLRIG